MITQDSERSYYIKYRNNIFVRQGRLNDIVIQHKEKCKTKIKYVIWINIRHDQVFRALAKWLFIFV